MKFLLLLVVLVAAAAWVFARQRQRKMPPPAAPPSKETSTAMLACAHCGVHVPQGEALLDAAGRPFCRPEHRVAGPR